MSKGLPSCLRLGGPLYHSRGLQTALTLRWVGYALAAERRTGRRSLLVVWGPLQGRSFMQTSYRYCGQPRRSSERKPQTARFPHAHLLNVRHMKLRGIAILFVVSTLAVTSCRRADEDRLGRELRCGMSRGEVEAVAKNIGYTKCFVPKLAAWPDVPEFSCTRRQQWASMWLSDDRLTAYQYGDSAAECAGQEYGCASPRIEMWTTSRDGSGRTAPD